MTENQTTQLYDVVAISIAPVLGSRRIVAERKTLAEADAIIKMATMRHGVEQELYETVPAND